MHVLHICGDYPFTPIYHQLLSQVAGDDTDAHTMYVPLAHGRPFSRKYDCAAPTVRVVYSRDFHQVERVLYHRKRKKILGAIEHRGFLDSADLVHAHYLFAAGGVALAIKQRRQLEYIVAVRNSDMNVFFAHAFHLRRFGLRILEGAARVVFISPAYRETLLARYLPREARNRIRDKSVVQPNGIDRFWFDNRWRRSNGPSGNRVNLLFVGEFSRNKNLPTLVRVTQVLRQRGIEATLRCVGAGSEGKRLRALAAQHADFVTVADWTHCQRALRDVYRQADLFLMPSFTETFGLVYIEALSQGLPIIYTQGQGVDGFFPDGTVGFACAPRDVQQIAGRIEQILSNYDAITANCTAAINRFDWGTIARGYRQIYHDVAGAAREAPAP